MFIIKTINKNIAKIQQVKIELISESNNLYNFALKDNNGTIYTISIYAPNYQTALSRVNNYSKHLEPEE